MNEWMIQFLIIPCSSLLCTGQLILNETFLPKVHSCSWSICINVCVLLLYSRICLTRFLYVLTLYWIKYAVYNCYVLFIHSLLPVSCIMYVVFPSFPFNPTESSAVVDAISAFFISSDLPVMSIIWLHLLVRIKSITFKLTCHCSDQCFQTRFLQNTFRVSTEILELINTECEIRVPQKTIKYLSVIEELRASWSNIWPRIQHLCKNN